MKCINTKSICSYTIQPWQKRPTDTSRLEALPSLLFVSCTGDLERWSDLPSGRNEGRKEEGEKEGERNGEKHCKDLIRYP